MELLGVFIVSPIWGFLSPRLFLRGWISFLGVLVSIVFLFKHRPGYKNLFQLGCTHFTEMFFIFTLLFAGFYIFYYHLPFGKTDSEVLVYLIFAMVQLAFILPSVSNRIDRLLEKAGNQSSS